MRWRISSIALAVSLALAGVAYAAPAGGQKEKEAPCAAEKRKGDPKVSGVALRLQARGCGRQAAAAVFPGPKVTGGTGAGRAERRVPGDGGPDRLGRIGRGAFDAKRIGPGGRLAKEAGTAARLLRAGKGQRRAGPFTAGSRAGGFLGEAQRKLAGRRGGNSSGLSRMLAGPNRGHRAGLLRKGPSMGSAIADRTAQRGGRRPSGAWDYVKSDPGTEALGRIAWEGAWGAGGGALTGVEGGPGGMAIGAGIGGGVAMVKAALEEVRTELGYGPRVTHAEPPRPETLGREYQYQRTETRTNGKVHIYRAPDGSEAHVVEQRNGERRIEYSKDGSVYAVEKYDRSGRLTSYLVFDSQSRKWVSMRIEESGDESTAGGQADSGSGTSGDSDGGGSERDQSDSDGDSGSDGTDGDSGDDEEKEGEEASADDGQAQAGMPRPECAGGPAASRPGPEGGCAGFEDPRREAHEREKRKAELTRAWTGQPTPEQGGGGSGGGCGRDDPYTGECVEPRGGPGWAADPGEPALGVDRRPADGGAAARLEAMDWAVDPDEGF